VGLFGKFNLFGGGNKLFSEIMDEQMAAVHRSLSGKDDETRKKIPDNIVAFIGASGGAGTSTLTINAAKALSRRGYSVLVIDLNILYPAVSNFLDTDGGLRNPDRLRRPDIVDFLVGKVEAGKAIKHIDGEKLSIMYAYNRATLDLLYADNEHTGELWGQTLTKLADLYDFVIADVPNQPVLQLASETLFKADRVFIVWDENINCFSVTERLRRIMEADRGAAITNKSRLIFNKRTSIHYAEEPVKRLGIRLPLYCIPFEPSVIESGLYGEIFITKGVSASKNAAIFTKRIKELADFIIRDCTGLTAENLDLTGSA
jgi:cellulose biosynthesis protein BcsQ